MLFFDLAPASSIARRVTASDAARLDDDLGIDSRCQLALPHEIPRMSEEWKAGPARPRGHLLANCIATRIDVEERRIDLSAVDFRQGNSRIGSDDRRDIRFLRAIDESVRIMRFGSTPVN